MEDVKKILVVTHMTKASRKTVSYGVSLAKKYGSELYVLHVIYHAFGTDLKGWGLPLPAIDETYRKIVKEETEALDKVISLEQEKGLSIKKLLKEGDPVKETLKVIEQEQIDLMIMSSHSEWRLEHMLFGRSADLMIRTMPCSILLVKEEPGKAEY